MASGWAKNETVAAKRRVAITVLATADNGPARPGTDLTGKLYIMGVTTPKYTAAVGTITNGRRPAQDLADDTVEAVDHATNDTLQLTAHLFETGDGPVRFTTSGTLPAGLSLATDYWLIKFDANNVRVATSLNNAYANSFINLTGAGTGTHTLDVTVSTERGVWGEFIYEATQAETNHDGKETLILVDGPGFERKLYMGGGAAVVMQEPASTAFDQVGENGHSYGDMMRIVFRTAVANFSRNPSTGDIQYRDQADTKNSHHGTITSAGRINADIDDAT